jgi:hypothetical protein
MKYHTGLPPYFPWLAILFLAVIVTGIPTLCIVAAVLWRSRASRRPSSHDAGQGTRASRLGDDRRDGRRSWPVPASYRRRSRTARLTGAGFGALAGIALVLSFRVIMAPVACLGGYLLGVLVGELWGWAPPGGAVREAFLRERRARDFAPGWAALLAVAAAVPVLAAPAILAIVPRISYGPWRPDPYERNMVLPGGQLSWPSAAATVPLAVVAITALALAVLSLRRVAAAPPLAGAGHPDSDRWWRCSAGRALLGAVVGIEALCLAAVLIEAGDGMTVPSGQGPGLHLGVRVLDWSGLAIAVGGLLVWLVLDGPGRHAAGRVRA